MLQTDIYLFKKRKQLQNFEKWFFLHYVFVYFKNYCSIVQLQCNSVNNSTSGQPVLDLIRGGFNKRSFLKCTKRFRSKQIGCNKRLDLLTVDLLTVDLLTEFHCIRCGRTKCKNKCSKMLCHAGFVIWTKWYFIFQICMKQRKTHLEYCWYFNLLGEKNYIADINFLSFPC